MRAAATRWASTYPSRSGAIRKSSLSVGGKGHVVEVGLSIASVAYGCLLGVFLLGRLWQGEFPVHLGPITIRRIALTWFVLIGAAATFIIGSLTSFMFGKPTVRKTTAVGTV